MGTHPIKLAFIGLYFGPARLTWNCLHPKRGRWNFRALWIPHLWASWDVSWPTVEKFRYARKLASRQKDQPHD